MLDGNNLTVEEYIELFTNMKELHPITEQEFEAEMLVMEQKKQLDGEKLSGEEAYEFILKAYEEAKQLEAERKENGID